LAMGEKCFNKLNRELMRGKPEERKKKKTERNHKNFKVKNYFGMLKALCVLFI
jgi:hypothetical protein